MDILQVNYIVIILSNSLLALLVFLSITKNTKLKAAQIHFLGFNLSLTGWIISLLLLNSTQELWLAEFVGRTAFVAPCLIMAFLYFFTLNFPRKTQDKPRTSKFVAINALVFSIISMTPLVIASVDLSTGIPQPGFGPAYSIYSLSILINLVLSFSNLFTNYKGVNEKEKIQIRIFSWGFGLTVILALGTNLIIPALTGDASLSSFGPYSLTIFLALITFTIVKHQFLEVRVLIARIIYYLTLSALPYTIFFALVFVYEAIFGTVFHPTVYFLSVFIGIAFVIAFNKTNDYIKNQVRSRLINPGYDPSLAAEQFNNSVSRVLDLESISKILNETLQRTIRPEFSNVIIFADEERHFSDRFYRSKPQTPEEETHMKDKLEEIKQLSKIIWESLGNKIIIEDNIKEETESGVFKNIPNIARDTEKLMEEFEARVIMPLSTKEGLAGIYVLGQKEADYPYTSQDLEFLTSISNTSSVAVERSLLYSEVQEFANTLQQKVDEATEELQKTNASLETALGEVQEARRKERDMIDVMGHELRTPISIVRNALSMLDREHVKTKGEVNGEKLAKYLKMGLDAARREIILIETLLSATKVDASRLQLHLEKVNFLDVIKDGIEGQRSLLEERKTVKLVYNQQETPIIVYTDKTRVQEVMDNFLSNALKYTQEGTVTINTWADDLNGYISISDTGMGIDNEDLRNLGKKFFRAKQYVSDGDKTDSKVVRPGGTGLGLYVTFELIRIMDGTLYINSQVGEGTTFTFSMPLHKGQEEKQYDQTFDADKVRERSHIVINGDVPKPPRG